MLRMMTEEKSKNWRIIPEYPSYRILDHTKCVDCPQMKVLKANQAKLNDDDKDSAVFIEHFPPEFKGDSTTKRIAMVGESPGRRETLLLKPFVGKSGQLLRKALLQLGYVRSEPPVIRLLITNSVKCRCVLTPSVEAVRSCSGALSTEIDSFTPDLIIALGKTAFHALTDKGLEHLLGENRRKTFIYRGFPVRLTYHPAAALRHTNYRILLYQDLKKYLALLLQ